MDVAHIVSKFDEELNKIEALLLEMGGLVESQIRNSIEAVRTRDEALAQIVMETDIRVNELEREIDDLTVRVLALRQPVASDLRAALCAMKVAGNLERIGDYAKGMARRMDDIYTHGRTFDGPFAALLRMSDIVQGMLTDVLDAYVSRDLEKSQIVWRRDDDVDTIYTSIFREILTYMMENPTHITAGMHLLFIAKNLERTGDHVTNMSEQLYFLLTGDKFDERTMNIIAFGGRDG